MRPDDISTLRGVNLNLFVALEALLEERSVTRAARRMGLSQPAASRALAELRRIFEDPLLVKIKGGHDLTPRARALIAPVRRALTELQRTLEHQLEFEPKQTRRALRIASADVITAVVLPSLRRLLQREAPHASVEVLRFDHRGVINRLEDGDIDVALGVELSGHAELESRVLGHGRLVCFSRAEHPVIDGPPDLERWLSCDHLLVSPGGGRKGFVDVALAAMGRERRVALRLPYFLAAMPLVERTDIIANMPNWMASLADPARVAVHPLPIAVPPFPLRMIWHARDTHDPAGRWLRARIVEAVGPELSSLALPPI